MQIKDNTVKLYVVYNKRTNLYKSASGRTDRQLFDTLENADQHLSPKNLLRNFKVSLKHFENEDPDTYKLETHKGQNDNWHKQCEEFNKDIMRGNIVIREITFIQCLIEDIEIK
jgi:hypothetical protein